MPDRAVPGDQMMLVIHRQRRDAVAGLDPQSHQRLRQLASIAGALRQVAGGPPVRPRGNDFAVAMLAFGVIDEPVMRSGQSCIAPSRTALSLAQLLQCDSRGRS